MPDCVRECFGAWCVRVCQGERERDSLHRSDIFTTETSSAERRLVSCSLQTRWISEEIRGLHSARLDWTQTVVMQYNFNCSPAQQQQKNDR